MLSKNCKICGKKFYKSKNYSLKVWNTTRLFCSNKCKSVAMIGKKQSKEQIYKKTKYPRFFICEICGKKIKNKRGVPLLKFCSRKCQGINRIGNTLGFKKGQIPWNKGLPGKSGKDCYFWQGGIYKNPYPNNWTKLLKESIRLRDKHKCQLCNKHQDNFKRRLDVHHIDYNKQNCNPKNLISLCRSCHIKTNVNRKYWISLFNNLA